MCKPLKIIMKSIKYTFVFFASILLTTLANGQSIIDLSKNTPDNTISIPGTYLRIDTSGLDLTPSSNLRSYTNETDQTVFNIEQKQLSIEDYNSFIQSMLKFDSIIFEKNILFNEYKGKMILGRKNIQTIDKEVWICYLGNPDLVIEIKGIYNSELHSKYNRPFDKVIKSLFIDSKRDMSIYEDLPFYLDEIKYPYQKELSFMPQSIALSKEVNGAKRILTIVHFNISKKEINEIKQGYSSDAEKCVINEKEIFMRNTQTDSSITVEAIIVSGNRLIQLQGRAPMNDESAVSEFKEIAKSIEFK